MTLSLDTPIRVLSLFPSSSPPHFLISFSQKLVTKVINYGSIFSHYFSIFSQIFLHLLTSFFFPLFFLFFSFLFRLLPSIIPVEDVVLRRVGRKEFIWQLDNPLICYDFAIGSFYFFFLFFPAFYSFIFFSEASETRKLVQFSVCSKSAMMVSLLFLFSPFLFLLTPPKKERIVFDEKDIFKQKCNEKLHHQLENIWLPDHISEQEMNQQFGVFILKFLKFIFAPFLSFPLFFFNFYSFILSFADECSEKRRSI